MIQKEIIALFDAIQHGDKEHREWLRDKFIEFFNENKDEEFRIFEEDFTIRNN
jgi:hypothetical protein